MKVKFAQVISALGQDAEGELYILTNAANTLLGKKGVVYKLVPQGS